jgi:glycosyltransferase involved in cell wall biosynthesis
MKRDAFRDLTHCNKMFEFISMGVPALVSRTRSVAAYFDDESFGWFTAGDEHDLARALREVHADAGLRRRLAAHAAEVAEPYRWPHQREVYLRAMGEQLA